MVKNGAVRLEFREVQKRSRTLSGPARSRKVQLRCRCLCLTAAVDADEPVELLVVGVVRLFLFADFADGEVLLLLVTTCAGLTNEGTAELHSFLAVVVADGPSRLVVQALQGAVVRAPCAIVVQEGQLTIALADIDFGRPFRAGVVDEPVVFPRFGSGRVIGGDLLGEELVHVELEGLFVLRYEPFFDGFDGCVDFHAVVIPVRHMSKS